MGALRMWDEAGQAGEEGALPEDDLASVEPDGVPVRSPPRPAPGDPRRGGTGPGHEPGR